MEIEQAEERTPVRLRDIATLFLKPTKFFKTRDLDISPAYLIAAWLVGLGSAIDRIDSSALKSDLDASRPVWDVIANSWIGFWAVVLMAGSIGAVVAWMLRGWWYRVRINWSGDRTADKREARLVFVFATLVVAIPTVLDSLIATFVYDNYDVYWNNDSLLPILLLIFPFWSVVVSYKGVRQRFNVVAWRARLLFFILPLMIYVATFGLLTFLLVYLGVYEPTYAT